MSIKILFQSRKSLFEAPGGDTIQLHKTKEYLEKLGLQIDISIELEPDLSGYDMVHIFNLMRGQETLLQVLNAKKQNKKVALSTIYGLYTEFDKKARGGKAQKIFKYLNPYQIEYVKVIARAVFGNEFHLGTISVLFRGYYKTLKKICEHVDVFLPNSNTEMDRIIRDFKLQSPKFVNVPNAVDVALFKDDVVISEKYAHLEGCVLSAARIEGRKCQLELVQALKGSPYKLVLVGKAAKYHQKYYDLIKEEAGDNVVFIEHLTQEELVQLYKLSKVHALVSWMETPGLSSLEAGIMGANVVITDKGDTRAYFEDMAFYCEPDDVQSIRNAIDKAYAAAPNAELKKKIIENYTWENTAKATLAGYKMILDFNN
ncbi:glycosyltransferase involved in cell wall biosynthesis [Pedobacter cryoconitis]|uniref:Glycosyltransferase involved in cell wall biosynthesis n=1 Tax=Pedobacter cryoconitis TaxID=188932 RepID=A0A7W8ZM79_9SPHI|nr:glycosyltransferase family 4 protein [Pedobacter cryoconitis]MBB5636588.1 glycosyltransferase involved in cell wall biosynthesis [Pedobacter cryoconitis]